MNVGQSLTKGVWCLPLRRVLIIQVQLAFLATFIKKHFKKTQQGKESEPKKRKKNIEKYRKIMKDR
jgi:hypothetical protein